MYQDKLFATRSKFNKKKPANVSDDLDLAQFFEDSSSPKKSGQKSVDEDELLIQVTLANGTKVDLQLIGSTTCRQLKEQLIFQHQRHMKRNQFQLFRNKVKIEESQKLKDCAEGKIVLYLVQKQNENAFNSNQIYASTIAKNSLQKPKSKQKMRKKLDQSLPRIEKQGKKGGNSFHIILNKNDKLPENTRRKTSVYDQSFDETTQGSLGPSINSIIDIRNRGQNSTSFLRTKKKRVPLGYEELYQPKQVNIHAEENLKDVRGNKKSLTVSSIISHQKQEQSFDSNVENLVKVIITLPNQSKIQYKLHNTITESDIKKKIVDQYYPELLPEQTILLLNGTKDPTLKDFMQTSNVMEFSLKVKEVWESQELYAVKKEIQLIKHEVGAVVMSCGHLFGRENMKTFVIEEVYQHKKREIRCPVIEGRTKCNQCWDQREWLLTAGFTQSKYKQILQKITENKQASEVKKCPFCHSEIAEQMISSTNRKVYCSNCKSKQFCFDCLKIWKNRYKNYCGNAQCHNPVFEQLNFSPENSDNLEEKMIQTDKKFLSQKISIQKRTNEFHDIVRKKIVVTVLLLNGKNKEVDVKLNATVEKLKKTIYEQHYSELKPEQTVIQTLQKVVLTKNQYVKTFISNGKIQLKQRKAEVWEIPHLKTDKNIEDPITCELGVAFMRCGHEYSRSAMKLLVQTQINTEGKYEVQCPIIKLDCMPCSEVLNMNDWQLVGGYTQSEMNELQTKMSTNWITIHGKLCPFCKSCITNYGMNTIKVRCSSCNSCFFCYNCLQKWTSSGNICNSSLCEFKRKQLSGSAWTRQFRLFNNKTKKYEYIKTPKMRACPRCSNIIQNANGCKHTPCPCTKESFSFCFICLGLYKNNKWACGSWNQYCGKVAPNQELK